MCTRRGEARRVPTSGERFQRRGTYHPLYPNDVVASRRWIESWSEVLERMVIPLPSKYKHTHDPSPPARPPDRPTDRPTPQTLSLYRPCMPQQRSFERLKRSGPRYFGAASMSGGDCSSKCTSENRGSSRCFATRPIPAPQSTLVPNWSAGRMRRTSAKKAVDPVWGVHRACCD